MTPLYLRLLLPAAVLLALGIALTRIDWKRYPGWFASMCWMLFVHGATRGGSFFPVWITPISTALIAWMIFESAARSRQEITPRAGARWFAWSLCGSAMAASCMAGLSLIGKAYLFRSYFLWMAAGSMMALCLLRLACPVLERPVDRVERWGVMLWILSMAMQGSFVTGGLGYALFHKTDAVKAAVATCAYWSIIVLLPGMSLAMWASAPGRKRAAKRRDGRTATGLIELERVA